MTANHQGRAVVSIQEAMALTGVSRRTIYNWLAQRRVAFIRIAGGQVRIYTDSLFRAPNPPAPALPPFPQGPLIPPAERVQVQAATRSRFLLDVDGHAHKGRGWR